jgi:hypothetical protein
MAGGSIASLGSPETPAMPDCPASQGKPRRGLPFLTRRAFMGGGGMAGELSGVPKAVLQTVFGRALGSRIWQRARRLPGAQIADAEIVGGMIEYVSQRAGETLGAHARQAKAIGLGIIYVDGVSRFDRMRLARPTNEGSEIGAAALELCRQSGGRNVEVESVELTVTSIEIETVRRRADGLEYEMAGALVERA